MTRRHPALVLALGAFLVTSVSGFGCFSLRDDDQCGSDADCPDDAVCDVGFGCGAVARCTTRSTCASDADCDAGEECVTREPREPEHPFDETIPGRAFCEPCVGLACGGGWGGGGWGGGGVGGGL